MTFRHDIHDSMRAILSHTLMMGGAIAALATSAFAQDGQDNDVIVVTGIRKSLQTALEEKRSADNLVEVIQAEDIGKLPDQNLAEVLENVTGIQITRVAGVGRGVQIRGTDANRVEINGVSTVGSGSGRSGISFEDLPAALIGSVEVVKVPEAKTIEGSVGGTINLRTLRALELDDTLLAFRAQAENSDLADETLPRYSATAGKKWESGLGEFGVVVSGSYARQDVAGFKPEVDRDGLVTPDSGLASAEAFPFLRIQYLNQILENYEYETYNFTGSVEWKPTDNFKLYFDATVNDQERAQESTRAQFSGVSAAAVVNNTTNTSFETIDFGNLDGPNGSINIGEVQAVLTGILEPGTNTTGNLDPNLRTSSDTGARVTESRVFALGGEWEREKLKVSAEASLSTSDSRLPNLSINLDFINPNSTQPAFGQSIDNGTPAEFDLRNGMLQFGIAQGLATTPTTAQLLDPANYQLQVVSQSNDSRDNEEKAFRVDVSYDVSDSLPFFVSLDAGYRWNENSAINEDLDRRTNYTNRTSSWNRPTADLFSEVVIAGPKNFNAADDRRLYIPDYLIINGSLAFSDPQKVVDAINAAIAASNAAATEGPPAPLLEEPEAALSAFFSIEETTNAAYLQANFDTNNFGVPVRGNAGLRYLSTEVTSVGNNVLNGAVAGEIVENRSYEFYLPRFNLAVQPAENFIVRAGVARDIRRPNFDRLSTSVTFGANANAAVVVGNPDLGPESVWSYDVSGEYYFAPSSLVSIGFFHKVRTDLFADSVEFPASNEVNGVLNIDITPPCEDGGIFNPIADRNINNPEPGTGICVPFQSTFNVAGETTQTGVELAFQHDLSAWEEQLGWASGFGFIGNFTYQEAGGDTEEFHDADGSRNIFTGLGFTDAQDRIELANLSKYAYNATLFYDKHGLSARARYTWRSDYLEEEPIYFGVPLVNDDRGQLNASVSYAINDNFTVGIEGINLTREDANQYCVNDDALLCFQNLTDRRVIAGANFRF